MTLSPISENADLAVLEFADVSVTWPDGTNALTAVDLKVGRGELVAVVGPSGCGKSTLLRVAAGLVAPSSGTVRRGTEEISLVFQDPTLLPWRSVLANVALPGELRGLDRADREARAQRALAAVGLADDLERLPAALSGGMRMRASLARALTLDPVLGLFDEPFSAVDELTREDLQEQMAALVMNRGMSALFVTHAVTEAVYLADRVAVLSPRPGRLAGMVEVPFSRPRPAALRWSAPFASICGQVSNLMVRP